MAAQFFLEGLDDGLRGVVFEEEVEVCFVLVDEAAKGGYVDLAEVAIHDVLHGKVEYFFKKPSLV